MTAYGGCEFRTARGVMGGESLRARASLTICQGHRKPQEGGVEMETETFRKKSIKKMFSNFLAGNSAACMALITAANIHLLISL